MVSDGSWFENRDAKLGPVEGRICGTLGEFNGWRVKANRLNRNPEMYDIHAS